MEVPLVGPSVDLPSPVVEPDWGFVEAVDIT